VVPLRGRPARHKRKKPAERAVLQQALRDGTSEWSEFKTFSKFAKSGGNSGVPHLLTEAVASQQMGIEQARSDEQKC